MSKEVSGKYSQKLINHAKHSATDTFKSASERLIKKSPEAFGHLIGNKLTYKITKVLNTSPQNHSKTSK